MVIVTSSAIKRVSGVYTIGNFVVVRGLSDRYIRTALNGQYLL